MAHFPWDVVVLVVLVMAVGVVLFCVLGRRIGAQSLNQTPPSMSEMTASNLGDEGRGKLQPPPLPGHVREQSSALVEAGPTFYVVPESGSVLAQQLFEVQKRVSNFNIERFLRQVDGGFRGILRGFAEGNRSALVSSLTAELLAVFDAAIEKRLAEGRKAHCDLHRLERLEVMAIETREEDVEIKVAITSWQVSYQTNAEGVLVEGIEALTEFRDLWSFVHAGDEKATWRLAGTAAL